MNCKTNRNGWRRAAAGLLAGICLLTSTGATALAANAAPGSDPAAAEAVTAAATPEPAAMAAPSPTATPPVPEATPRTLQEGSHGNDVTALQEALTAVRLYADAVGPALLKLVAEN